MSQLKSRLGQSLQSLRNTIKHYATLYLAPILNFYIYRKTPIIVYQMGKVGSSSIVHSLEVIGYQPIYHLHFMSPQKTIEVSEQYQAANLPVPFHVLEGQQLYRHVVQRKYPAKYITLVREPIGRVISDFFQNYELHTGHPFGQIQYSLEETMQLFFTHSNPDFPLTWFDDEFLPTLAINVYNYPFPHEQGFLRIRQENVDLLVLRLKTSDAILSDAVREFTGITDFRLQRANEADTKNYSVSYNQLRQFIKLPDNLVDRLLAARTRNIFTARMNVMLFVGNGSLIQQNSSTPQHLMDNFSML